MEKHIIAFTRRLIKQTIPDVEKIVEIFNKDPEHGFDVYLDFIKKIKPSIEKIILEGLRDPIDVGYISSRLLRDPLEAGIDIEDKNLSLEEVEGHIVGYLKAILQLLYCGSKGLEGWQYPGSSMHKKTVETQYIWKINILPSFLEIIEKEVAEIELKKNHLDDELKKTVKEGKRREISKSMDIGDYEYLYGEEDGIKTDIPFTARLMAYYRAQESKSDAPLFIDSFAKELAGDFSSYAEKHKFTVKRGDYPLVRSYFIEKNLLTAWCNQKETQIVLLGAGLDSRAYRFLPLKTNNHIVFEIDLDAIIKYKEKILHNKKPLCKVTRVAIDLSQPSWESYLIQNGYSLEIPTFWILEGLVYYIDQKLIITLLRKMAAISHCKSKIFMDICVPALAGLVFGPFTRHFKWGLEKRNVPSFFTETGWSVTCSYADDYNEGRDIGQRGLIFVYGYLL
ncbi:class I SAM-dependent methyltransferase [Candidatus Hodarchaeum mangrovi]